MKTMMTASAAATIWLASAAAQTIVAELSIAGEELAGPGLQMAGETFDDGFEVFAVDYGGTMLMPARGGRARGGVEFEPVTLTMPSSVATPRLLDAMARGRRVEATITFAAPNPANGAMEIVEAVSIEGGAVTGVRFSADALAGRPNEIEVDLSWRDLRIEDTRSGIEVEIDMTPR